MSVLGAAIGALGALGSGALTADAYNQQNNIAQSQFRENMQWQKQQNLRHQEHQLQHQVHSFFQFFFVQLIKKIINLLFSQFFSLLLFS